MAAAGFFAAAVAKWALPGLFFMFGAIHMWRPLYLEVKEGNGKKTEEACPEDVF